MDSSKQFQWFETLFISIIFLFSCQSFGCSVKTAKTINPEPTIEIQKIPVQPPNQGVTQESSKKIETNDPQKNLPDSNTPLQRDIIRSVKSQKEEETNPQENEKKETLAMQQMSYTGKPISLDFQNADISSVLRLISDISGHNLVIDPDVKGKVSITLHKPVPWDQALEIILKTNRLAMKMEGNILRVGTRRTFTQEEEANLKAIQARQMTERAKKKSLPLTTEIISINYSQVNTLKDQLSPMLSNPEGLSANPSIIVDERTNSIIVKDTPGNIQKIKEILADLDKETPQVMIETRIVETTKDFSKELGVRWGGGYQKETNYRFPYTVDVTGIRGDSYAVNLPNTGDIFGGLGLSLGHIESLFQLNMELDAMEMEGKGRIISNPRIATLDNEKALIQCGDQIPYPSVDKDGNPTTQFVDAVIKLAVTPHITPNNYITLEIEANKSEPNWDQKINGVPAIKTRTAKTKLIVKDGNTTVIGGLYKQSQAKNERKVPFFGSIPIIKYLFMNKSKKEYYDELLIFITPKIIVKK